MLAAKVAQRVVQAAPGWSDGLLTFARILRELGEVRKSIEIYDSIIVLEPLNEPALGEREEMRRVLRESERLVAAHQSALINCADSDEAEVIRCFMNLTSRVRVLQNDFSV